MPFESWLALLLFATVMSVTPGPNNAMALASGVNFGFRRTIPHLFGISVGYGVMLVIVGMGIGALMLASPLLVMTMRFGSGAYMFWLAWTLARSTTAIGEAHTNRPLTFLQAALFQWINPKGWAIALTTVALYTHPNDPFGTILLIGVLYVVVCVPACSLWAGFGVTLRGFLSNPRRLRIFNITTALLLVASTLPVLLETT